MYSPKIDKILSSKTGYYADDRDVVIFIFEDPNFVKVKMSILGGFRLFAVAVDKETGDETKYSLSSKENAMLYDLNKLKRFKSFGSKKSTTLLEDLGLIEL